MGRGWEEVSGGDQVDPRTGQPIDTGAYVAQPQTGQYGSDVPTTTGNIDVAQQAPPPQGNVRATWGSDVGTTTQGINNQQTQPPVWGGNPIDAPPITPGQRAPYTPSGTIPGVNPGEVVPVWPPNGQPQQPGGQPTGPIDPATGLPLPRQGGDQSGGSRPPGTNGLPAGQVNYMDPNKDPYGDARGIVENSLYLRSNPKHHIEHGAVAGLGLSVGQFGLDQWTRGMNPETRPGWANWVQKHYSPTADALVPFEKDLAKAGTLLDDTKATMSAANLQRTSALSDMTHAFQRGVNPDALGAKTTLIQGIGSLDDFEAAKAAGYLKDFAPDELAAARTYVEKNAAASLAANAHANAASGHTTAQSALTAKADTLKFSMTRTQMGGLGIGMLGGALIGAKLDKEDPWHGAILGGIVGGTVGGGLTGALNGSIGKGIGLGMVVAGGQVAFNTGINYLATGDLKMENNISYGVAALGVPAILAFMPGSPTKKAVAVATTLGLSGVVDHFAGPPSARLSEWLRPNWADAGFGVAAMLAPGGMRVKGPAMVAAWGAGRLYGGIVAPVMGWDGEDGARLRDAARNDFAVDMRGQSAGSFREAVSSGRKLGIENEASLELELADFLRKNYYPVAGVRNDYERLTAWETNLKNNGKDANAIVNTLSSAAAYTASVGEFRLETGSRLVTVNSRSAKHGVDSRIMTDQNYDLGGEATSFLRQAGMYLFEAQQYGKNNGVSQDSLNELKKKQQYVDEQLNKIYGNHDMDKAFNTLKDAIPGKLTELTDFGPRLKQYIDTLQTQDTRYKAKLCRDYALYCMAWTQFQADRNNGGDANVMLNDAMKYATMAQQLDGNSEDGKWLMSKGPDIAKKVGVAITNQEGNSFNNPHGVQNGAR